MGRRGDRIGRDVVALAEVDRTRTALVGGKGALLGELMRIGGVRVPDGVCVTAAAYRRVLDSAPTVAAEIAGLAELDADDHDEIAVRSARVRSAVESLALPDELVAAIAAAVGRLGEDGAFAVRSSATAEDLPSASFAGQHDTFLNVGAAEVVRRVVDCWASLFSERAVAYRRRAGFDHTTVGMAVVVQRMVDPQMSGVLFTADPVSGHRRISTIEAVAGLGEALVAGRVPAEAITVRDGALVGPERGDPLTSSLLTEERALELERLGRRVEAHLGAPQDVEWCLADDGFWIVQSRPITTLFPIPDLAGSTAGEGATDAGTTDHVWVSVGHQQMMTDAMRPLGLSFWRMTTPRHMDVAGSRLFVDVTDALAVPASRAALLDLFGRGDPRLRDALETVLDRGDVVRSLPEDTAGRPPLPPSPPTPLDPDPALVVELIERNRASVEQLRVEIRSHTGPALFDFIREDLEELRRLLVAPDSHRAAMAGMEASWWLNDRMEEWLGVRNAADAITRSAPNNVTSEMGLALLDVADEIRPHAEVVARLEQVEHQGRGAATGFLDELAQVPGGVESVAAIRAFLDAYGMRCVGEIDITRTRWAEAPEALVPVLLGNVATFEPGESQRRVDRGLRAAADAERDLLARVGALPGGADKAAETRAATDRVRTFIGYREYPKYGMISRYAIYKQALLAEADRLVAAGVLADREDVYFLDLEELERVVAASHADMALIEERRADFERDSRLTAPRVLTSDGECLQGTVPHDGLAPGVLAGLGVSSGVAEGRARVVVDLADADLQPGDILVTRFTDPSWSPVFVSIGGLVTEVGGLMSHGAVVAREYGLPTVVGVERATEQILDGQRVRVDGTHGTVEVLAGG